MTSLLVDDDDTLRTLIAQAFGLENIPIRAEADPRAALKGITADFPGVVVTDVRMPSMDGLTLFRHIHEIDADIPVILMTGHGDVPMVIDAMKGGVFDFIQKPFSPDHLIASVRRALEVRGLVLENRALRAAATSDAAQEVLIGETPVMLQLLETIRQLAQTDIDVLVEGETGTGKELAALLLRRLGRRRGKPFVTVNCAALPPGIAEAELLGYAPGAQAGQRWGQTGLIESADKGTLFLDEIGSMPASIQGILLRVLEEREIQPIGAKEAKPLDIRVIAAANTELVSAVERGEFRKDLYFRLNAAHLRIPALRERRADISLLFAHFLNEASGHHKREVPPLGREVHLHLSSHDWPGNVRELRTFAQRVVLGLDRGIAPPDPAATMPLPQRVAQFEAMAMREALQRSRGDVQHALGILGIPRNTFYDKAKKYGIDLGKFRDA